MNINAMVRQNSMVQSFAASVKNSSTKAGEPNNFEKDLQAFRKENLFAALDAKKAQKLEKEDELKDLSKILCSDSLYDVFDDTLSAEDALKKLDGNLAKIKDYSLDSMQNVREVLQHIGVQNTLYKRHIAKVGTKKDVEQLEKLVARHSRRYANSLADTIGAFYENEGGIEGERDRMYESAMDSIVQLTRQYDSYIAAKGERFAKLLVNVQENGLSLANELRKETYDKYARGEGHRIDLYPSTSILRAEMHYREAHHIQMPKATYDKSEEELGFEAGKAMVQALSKIDDRFGMSIHDMGFITAIRKKIDGYLNEVDEQLQIKAQQYAKENPNDKENPFTKLNREAVYAVENAMVAEYKESGDIAKALAVGKDYGMKQYLAKVDVEGETERYKDSPFWRSIIKDALSIDSCGKDKYKWIMNLLNEKAKAWLNVKA